MEVHYNKYCQKCTGKVVMHAFSKGPCTLCDKEISTSHTPCDKVCDSCSDEKGVCMSCGDTLGWKPEVWHGEKHGKGKYTQGEPIKILNVDPISEENLIAMHNAENPDQHTSVIEMTANEILDKYKDYLDPTAEEMLLGRIERHLQYDREYKAKGTWEDVLRYADNMGKEKQILEGLILTWRHKLKDGCQERADSLRQASEWHEHDDEEFAIIQDACFTPLRDFDKHFSITEQRHGQILEKGTS